MTRESDGLAAIRANADLVVEEIGSSSGLEHFGFDDSSVEWIDGFIERQRVREDVGPEFVDRMVEILGSYLGECIIHCYGGQWVLAEGRWRVEFDRENAVFPFTKVQKQFAHGHEDSIYSLFAMIPRAFPNVKPLDRGTKQQGPGTMNWLRRIRGWFGLRPHG